MKLTLFFVTVCAWAQNTNLITVIPTQTDSAVGELHFREKYANGANYTGFKAPASLASNLIWELPGTFGTSGQCLLTNGSGVFYFGACSGGSTTLPVVDSTAIVSGSSDATKLMRFEVDGLTTATTRVMTIPDADITLVGRENAEMISGAKSFSEPLTVATLSGTDAKISLATDSGADNALAQFTTTSQRTWLAGAFRATDQFLIGDSTSGTYLTMDGVTGNLVFPGTVKSGNLTITGAAATNRFTQYNTLTTPRMQFGVDNTAETGLNAGSNVVLDLYDDGGSFLSQPFYIIRSSGTAVFTQDVNVGGDAAITGIFTAGSLGADLPPDITFTRNLGNLTHFYSTLFVENVDGAPAGRVGNYMQTRQLKVGDLTGGAGFWDFIASANGGSATLKIRDQGGDPVIEWRRIFTSITVNYANVYADLVPAQTGTYAKATMGETGNRWDAFVNNIEVSGTNLQISESAGTIAASSFVQAQNLIATGGTSDFAGTVFFHGSTELRTGSSLKIRSGATLDLNSGSTVTISTDLIPSATTTYKLGDSTHTWQLFSNIITADRAAETSAGLIFFNVAGATGGAGAWQVGPNNDGASHSSYQWLYGVGPAKIAELTRTGDFAAIGFIEAQNFIATGGTSDFSGTVFFHGSTELRTGSTLQIRSGGALNVNSGSTFTVASGTPGAGKVLMDSGAGSGIVIWGTAGAGTVTSIATSGPIGGGTITGSGTITCSTCAVTTGSTFSGSITMSGADILNGAGTVRLGSTTTPFTAVYTNALSIYGSNGRVESGATLRAASGGTINIDSGGTLSSQGTAGITGSTCSSFRNGLCIAP